MAEYRAAEEELLRSGQPLLNKDEPHEDPTGNPRTILTSKVPLKDGQGKVVGLVGISRDITERKQAEETLRLTQFSVDHAADPVFWIGPDAVHCVRQLQGLRATGVFPRGTARAHDTSH